MTSSVGPGGYLDVTLNGNTSKYTIRIGEGSFGIVNGKVAVEEGTHLTFDGSPYVRKGGVWIKGEADK